MPITRLVPAAFAFLVGISTFAPPLTIAYAAPRRTVKARKAAPPKGDPQTLVSRGKRPAFYEPKNLAKSPVLSAPSAILIDSDTGQVLWEKNADVLRAPASTTKIMTALLFIESSQPSEIVTCTDRAITKIEESSLHIKMWEKFTVEDLLHGFMLRSGNDGAVLIAQFVDGTVYKFSQRMNARAQEIGAVNTHFVNPHGLSDPNHYSTARDLALITREALRNPRFAECVANPSRVIKRSMNQTDTRITMRVKKKFYDKFPGADGVKTGYTRAAGHCFVGSATRGGRRLLSVVLGAPDSASADTIPLMSWGFARFPAVSVAEKDKPVGVVPVRGGTKGEIQAVAATDLRISADSLAPGGQPTAVSEVRPADVSAPIQKGQVVGKVIALLNGVQIAETNLLAAEDVPAAPVVAAVSQVTNAARAGGGWVWSTLGVAGAGLVVWRYGAAFTKSNRRRRSHLAAAGRGDDRGGTGPR